MHHHTTKRLHSGMRSKKTLQGIKRTGVTKSSSRQKRTHQRCRQNKLLQMLRPYKGEKNRDRRGDTNQRKGEHSRQWSSLRMMGFSSLNHEEEEDYSTVNHNSGD